MPRGAPKPKDTDPGRLDVLANRYREARREARLAPLEARLFARSDLDIGILRRLYRAGCPPDMIARILF